MQVWYQQHWHLLLLWCKRPPYVQVPEARERCGPVPQVREGRAHWEELQGDCGGVPLLLQLRQGGPRVGGLPWAQGHHELQGLQELRWDRALCVRVHAPQAWGQEALPPLRQVRPHPGGLPQWHEGGRCRGSCWEGGGRREEGGGKEGGEEGQA